MKLTEPQRYAARMLAMGVPAPIVASRLDITPYKLASWGRNPVFEEQRALFARHVMTELENDLITGVAEMQHLWLCWLRGELPANDPRIAVIAPSLLKLTEQYIGITPGKAGTAYVIPAPTVAPALRSPITEDDPDAALDELRELSPPRSYRKRQQAEPGSDTLPVVEVSA